MVKGLRVYAAFAGLVLILACVLFIYYALTGHGFTFEEKSQPVVINYVTGPYQRMGSDGGDLTSLYEAVSPAVVSVMSQTWVDTKELRKEGTGFFIDNRHVITNYHVVSSADSVEVGLINGDKLMAELIGGDMYSDLAVLRTEMEVDVTPLSLANSSLVTPGTPVAALGNPFGLDGSIVSGIISAKGRMLKTYNDFLIANVLQTDAPLNPGNSGGPLVTRDGLVVGVNVAKEGDNIGFAIPSNTVAKIVPVIISGGQYNHPWMGIIAQPVTKKLAGQLDLQQARGLQILQVNEGGPADLAGLRGSDKLRQTNRSYIMSGGDILTHINGVEVNTFTDLMNYLEDETRVGDEVTVTYIRNNKVYDTKLVLGVRK